MPQIIPMQISCFLKIAFWTIIETVYPKVFWTMVLMVGLGVVLIVFEAAGGWVCIGNPESNWHLLINCS